MSSIRGPEFIKPCGQRNGGLRKCEPFPLPMGLEAGDRVRLDCQRLTWTVTARSEHFAVLIQQAPFRPRGEVQYTILDPRHGIYGPANTIGQGWDLPDGALDLLTALESGEREVSFRNRCQIQTIEVTE